jgi:hypothetical protein
VPLQYNRMYYRVATQIGGVPHSVFVATAIDFPAGGS